MRAHQYISKLILWNEYNLSNITVTSTPVQSNVPGKVCILSTVQFITGTRAAGHHVTSPANVCLRCT